MIQPFSNTIARAFFILLVIVAFSTAAKAFPGELDTTFNNTGFARLSFGFGNDSAYAVAVQTDGKIVTGGYAINGWGDEDFALVRYNANGSLDTSFGEGGKAVFLIKDTDERAYAIAIQPDGKIIAAGASTSTNFSVAKDSVALIRFNADGSLDSTFGDQGVVIMTTNLNQRVTGLAVQTDGKIVVTGPSMAGSISFGFKLYRFNADGTLDENFGINGVASLVVANLSYSRALAIQADGKIVVGGAATNGSYWNFALARFNENGTLDKRFGYMGRTTVSISAKHDEIYSLALQPDGKIIAGGYSADAAATPSYTKFAVARFLANGRLDTSFGDGGKTVTSFGNNADILNSVTLQPDGGIVAAGESYDGNKNRIVIARYLPGGVLDTSFGTGGKVITYFQNIYSAKAYGIALQTDGKILTAGFSASRFDVDFTVFRYNTDGSLDNGFDTDGSTVTDAGNAGGAWFSVLVQKDSKIIAIGYGYNEAGQAIALFRYNADGSPDPTFGANGLVMTRIGSSADGLDGVIQPDGKILVCSYSNNGYAVARYNNDGSLDAGFGTNGIQNVVFGVANRHTAALDLQSGGKIIITGSAMRTTSSEEIFTTLRLNTNGSLDTTFGENGIAWTALGANYWPPDVKVQSDDKIVIAGTSLATTVDFTLIRYNADGSLDNTFGSGGIVTTAVGPWWDEANEIFIQPDGKILVAGIVKDNTFNAFSRIALVRYLPNGLLDTTFNGNGKVITSINADSWANSVVMQPDGKIVLGGKSTSSFAAFHEFTLARYKPNGMLDETFGEKSLLRGTITYDLLNGADIVNSIALQPDGKIVGVGLVGSKLGVARFLSE